MKKLILSGLLLAFCYLLQAQKIKHFDSFLKLSDLSTRYVVVLEDNSIWWYTPGQAWLKSNTEGLPAKYDIKHFAAFSKPDGDTRYVAVLSDNSIWWYAPDQLWTKSSTIGLPAGYSIKHFNAFTKEEDTRYVAVLSDNSIWWYAPDQPWEKTLLEGLPK